MSSPYYGVRVKIFRDFVHLGPNYGWKGFSQKWDYFYVEANVRISYMGPFFEAMVLKLCTGYLVYITEYVWKFFAISSILARIMGKKRFFQKLDLVIFSTLRQM